jgi:putative aldouronate transport system substrate-binding protein
MDAFKDYGYNFGVRPDFCYNYEEDTYMFGPEQANYKAMLKYFNKLWKEGLMDPEFFTASLKQFEDKLLNGLGVFYYDWAEYSYKYLRTKKELSPDSKYNLLPTMPLTSDVYSRKIVQKASSVTLWNSMCISAETEVPDRLIKFVDWLYTDEGATISRFGIKGTHYNLDSDGKGRFVSNIQTGYNPNGTEDPLKIYGINLPHMKRNYCPTDEVSDKDKYQINTEAVIKQYFDNIYLYPVNNDINLTFTEDELITLKAYRSDINTCVNEWSIGFVTGDKSLDDYDKFLAETKARHSNEVLAIYKASYDRFKAKMKEIKK